MISRLSGVDGVGEGVEVDDALASAFRLAARQPVEHKVAADEAGAGSNEDCHAITPTQ